MLIHFGRRLLNNMLGPSFYRWYLLLNLGGLKGFRTQRRNHHILTSFYRAEIPFPWLIDKKFVKTNNTLCFQMFSSKAPSYGRKIYDFHFPSAPAGNWSKWVKKENQIDGNHMCWSNAFFHSRKKKLEKSFNAASCYHMCQFWSKIWVFSNETFLLQYCISDGSAPIVQAF